MRDMAEHDDRRKIGQCRDARDEKTTAGLNFSRERFVAGRHAAHGVRDHAIDQRETATGTATSRYLSKTEFNQGRVEQVAGGIAHEWLASPICALQTRRKADDQQARVIDATRTNWGVVPLR